MQAGRPVFVVPPEAEYLKLKNALVAWKDTREARRAVADALPLLRKAEEINVVEVIEDDSDRSAARARVDDVAAWLSRHQITRSGWFCTRYPKKQKRSTRSGNVVRISSWPVHMVIHECASGCSAGLLKPF